MSAGTIAPGKVVDQRFWHCANCGQKLAEIIGERVRIERGKIVVTLALKHDPDQVCPRCGAVSALSLTATVVR